VGKTAVVVAVAIVAAVALSACGRIGFAPTPDATPDGLDNSDRLVNGDFSTDLQGWQIVRVSNGTVGEPYPDVGIWYMPSLSPNCLCIDAPLDSDAYAEQTVTVPAGRQFRWSMLSWGGEDPVSVTLSFVDGSGAETIVDAYDPPCKQDHGCVTPESRGYEIAGYVGTTLTVRMRNTSPNGNRTRAFFDDVSLREF